MTRHTHYLLIHCFCIFSYGDSIKEDKSKFSVEISDVERKEFISERNPCCKKFVYDEYDRNIKLPSASLSPTYTPDRDYPIIQEDKTPKKILAVALIGMGLVSGFIAANNLSDNIDCGSKKVFGGSECKSKPVLIFMAGSGILTISGVIITVSL